MIVPVRTPSCRKRRCFGGVRFEEQGHEATANAQRTNPFYQEAHEFSGFHYAPVSSMHRTAHLPRQPPTRRLLARSRVRRLRAAFRGACQGRMGRVRQPRTRLDQGSQKAKRRLGERRDQQGARIDAEKTTPPEISLISSIRSKFRRQMAHFTSPCTYPVPPRRNSASPIVF